MENQKTELEKLKNEVLEFQSEWNQKYMHLKSVDNFIYHFDEIKFEADKIWVFDSLTRYLFICKKISEKLDRKTSNQLYYDNLEKIAAYYRNHLQFRMILNHVSYIALFLITILIIYFLFGFVGSLVIIPFYIIFFIQMKKKQNQKIVYGIFY